jgi:hypothetical protein
MWDRSSERDHCIAHDCGELFEMCAVLVGVAHHKQAG